MKPDKNKISTTANGVNNFLAEFGKICAEMKKAHDVRNIAYKDVDANLPDLSLRS